MSIPVKFTNNQNIQATKYASITKKHITNHVNGNESHDP